MPSTQVPSRRSRKPTETYSLTVEGDSFRLITSNQTAMATTPPPPPPKLLSEQISTNDYTYPPTASSARPYVPHIPVPRGPRARNLYLYPPTDADYLKAQQRSISKANAMEDARIEREDDKRRRAMDLGILPPRKSTRRIKFSANVTTELEGVLAAAGKSSSFVEQVCKKRRGGIVKKKSIVQSKPFCGDASISSASLSGLLSTPSIPSETPRSPQKSRRKAPKSNPRATQRLTTRSLANLKAKSNAIGGGEINDLEAMDLDVETRSAKIGSGMNSASPTSTTHHPQEALTHDSKMADSQLDLAELPEKSDNRASLISDSSLPSSETLFDDMEVNSRDLSKEAVFPGSPHIHAIKSSSSIGSNASVLITGHGVSPSASISPPPATVMANDQNGKKRKLEEVDVDPQPPAQFRRSSRIPKKRKLQ